jgi:hypothetical protein
MAGVLLQPEALRDPSPRNGGKMPKARRAAKPRAAVTKENGSSTPHVLTPVLTHEDIARRAFEIFEQSGGQHGRDIQHWLDAERQLLEHQ